MNNSRTDRSTLKGYFVKNAVPTQQQFAELIDSGINLAEDGLTKDVDASLCVQASRRQEQSIIDLYRDFTTLKPVWRYEMNPLRTPGDPGSSNPGLALRDDHARMRLYLQEDEPLAGIGTLDPKAALQIVAPLDELRTVGSGSAATQEAWSYLGLATERRIALELGENGAGKIGSLKLNGSRSNEFAFLRPGDGSVYLDATGGDYYLNFDADVRRLNPATLHLAAADGSEHVRLATDGASWFTGGSVGIGTATPDAGLQVAVSGANGDNYESLAPKLALRLGSDSTVGAMALQGGTAETRVFAHGHAGMLHLDSSTGEYHLNQSDVSEGKAGQLHLGDATGASALTLRTDGHSHFAQPVSIGTETNAALLHLNVAVPGALQGKTEGIRIESGGNGHLDLTHDSISSSGPLRLQPDGGEIRFGGSLDVEERLTFDQDEYPGQFFLEREVSEGYLQIGAQNGVQLLNTGPATPEGYQDFLVLATSDNFARLGMDRDHLGIRINEQRPFSIMRDGQVLINQDKPLDSPLAVRGRIDLTGLSDYTTYKRSYELSEWIGQNQFDSAAELVLTSIESEVAIATKGEHGGKSTLTLAVFEGNADYAERFQLELAASDPQNLRWTYRNGAVGPNHSHTSSESDDWRALEFDAEMRRTGIGRGQPAVALDVEGAGDPDFGVQLLVRESSDSQGRNNSGASGAAIGFTSPHFQHPNFQHYDYFDIGAPGSGPESSSPHEELPVIGYVGLQHTHTSPNQPETESTRLEIATRYDLPIDFRINGSSLLHLHAEGQSGAIEVGQSAALREPGAPDLTFRVHPQAQFLGEVKLESGLEVQTGTANFKQALVVEGAGQMNGGLQLNGDFHAYDAAVLHQGLSVTDATTLNGDATVTGVLTASGRLDASSTVNLNDGVTVNGTANLNGAAVVTGTLDVTGNTQLQAGLNVVGSANFGEQVTVAAFTANAGTNLNGNTIFRGDLTANEPATFAKTLSVNGAFSALGSATFAQGMAVTGTTTLNGAAAINGQFNANAIVNLNGNTNISGNLQAIENSVFRKELAVEGVLRAKSAAEMQGALSVTGPTQLNGTTTLNGPLNATQAADFAKDVRISGAFFLTGEAILNSIQTSGPTFLNGDLIANATTDLGVTNIGGLLTATQDANFGKAVTITGPLNAAGGANFGSDIRVNGAFSSGEAACTAFDNSGPTYLGGSLDTSGPATFAGTLTAREAAAFTKDVTINGELSTAQPFIAIGEDTLDLSGADPSQCHAVTLTDLSQRAGILELEIWHGRDFYARMKVFPGSANGHLDFREIEIFQSGDRYVAGFESSATSAKHVLWLKGGTTYQFRASDKMRLSAGLAASIPGDATVDLPASGSDYDHDNVHLRRGAVAQDRFVSFA
ncbi:MAG: hypothetical protein AAF998_22300 [Bacteroidota bacterium]